MSRGWPDRRSGSAIFRLLVRPLSVRPIALLLVACLLAGCEQAAPPPPDPVDPDGTIATTTPEPETIDPQKGSFAAEVAQMLMVYEPLLTYDPKSLQPVPAAARALPVVSEDGLTVTFTLRDKLTYSDGAPLTAGDFAYAWTRLCDPNTNSEYAFTAYVIAGCEAWNNMDPKRADPDQLQRARDAVGVRATDDLHVAFTLIRPAPYFLAVAALWVGVPTRASDVATGPGWTEPATYIGNGPFTLVEWTHNTRLVFERNARYRAPARLKRWTKLIVTDGAVARQAFANGELDVAPAVKDPGAVAAPPGTSFYIGFNTLRPPFDDPAVRLAFARALDRSAYADAVVDPPAVPAESLIPMGLPGSDPADRTQSFDPVAARMLLASSRYAAGLPPIRFSYLQRSSRSARLAKWAVAQWAVNLGVAVLDDPISDCGFCQLVKTPQTQPQLFSLGWIPDYPDPQDLLTTIFHSSSRVTRTGYHSDEFDALVARADVERDPSRRIDLYQQAQRVLTHDAPVAFVYSTQLRYLVSSRVLGYTLSAIDWDFGQFSLATMYVAKRRF